MASKPQRLARDLQRRTGWPYTETSATMRELHSATSAWDTDSHRAFKDQRVRLTGSSRAVDL